MKKIPLLLFSVFWIHNLIAQDITISGTISSQNSGETLIGATVLDSATQRGMAANEYGFYQLKLKQGTHVFYISSLGYKAKRIEYKINSDTAISIQLNRKVSQLAEVEVKAESKKSFIREAQTSVNTLNNASIRKLSPQFIGEVDVLKSLQALPGVQGGREGVTQLSVRGGDPGQNLIILDGIPIFYTSHLLGFLSVFNSDAIKQVKLYKGGFPARYSGRLSSVIDIRLKEGNKKQTQTKLDVGVLSTKLTVESPINSKTSYIISGRTTPLSLMAWAWQKYQKSKNLYNYNFYDFTAKINHQFNKKNRLFLSAYTGKDIFKSDYKTNIPDTVLGQTDLNFNLNWGNAMGLLRYNHIFRKNIFSNLSLVFSRYSFGVHQNIEGRDLMDKSIFNYTINKKYESIVNQMGAHWDFYASLLPNYNLRAGISYSSYKFKPNAIRFNTLLDTSYQNLPHDSLADFQKKDTLYNSDYIPFASFNSYIENSIKIGHIIELNAGLHFNQNFVDDTSFISIEPRLNLSIILNSHLSAKFSYAKMQQNLHLLGNSTLGLPTDIWIPATKRIPPEKSQQITGGIYSSFGNFFLTSEFYYKKMESLAEFKAGTNFLRDGLETDLTKEAGKDWQNRTLQGKGDAYGMDFQIQKTNGKWQASASYGLLWSWRTFSELNTGLTFPYRYGRRHKIDLNFNFFIKKNIIFTANWQYSSGFYTSLPFSKYPAYFRHSPNYNGVYFISKNSLDSYSEIKGLAQKNNFQVPAYNRLDVSLSFKKKKKRGIRTWNIGVYNVYNRKNAFSVYAATNEGKVSQITLFPILPSISYRFVF